MKFITTFFFTFAASSIFFGQSVISGKITDGEFSDPLPFANISIKASQDQSSSGGTTSDFDGYYAFEVSGGSYELTFSFVGYQTQIIKDVKVGNNEEITVNITLQPIASELDEVIITSSARKNDEASVLAIQKRAATVMDGLSATSIKKSGDSNIASAIKRIPGVSVQGGKFVYVRGLGDRYSKTLLGGIEVPGLDPDRNTLQLDIFPTSLLENIIVSKSSSSDQNVDFTGGIVDVILRDFSSIPEYSLSVSTGYNTLTNLKDAPALPKNSLNFLRFNNGENNLPINSNLDLPFPETFLSSEDILKLNFATNALTKQLGVSRENNLLDYNFGITASNQYRFKNDNALGFIASLNYRYDADYYENIFNGALSKEINGLERFSSQEGELGTINALASGLFGLSFKTTKTKHKLNLLAIKSGESSAINGVIQDFLENPYYGVANIMAHTERNIVSVPVSGAYAINENFKIDWKIAPSSVLIKDLDFRKTVFNKISEITYLIDQSTTQLPQRLWRNLDEKSISSRIDFDLNYTLFDSQSKLKFGAFSTEKNREFGTNNYQIGYLGRSSNLNGDFNAILDLNNIWNPQTNAGSFILGSYQRTNQYKASSSTMAFYVSNEAKISEKLKVILGLRFEKYLTRYTGETIEREVFDNKEFINVADLYPSLNIIQSLNDNTNFRLSYSKTTARPTFRENSSAQIYDPITERFFLGNTDLNPTYIDNFDFRFEQFGEGNQILASSIFYKRFIDPIEVLYYNANSPNILIGRNNDHAAVFGVEFEWRKNLINNDIQRLSLNINSSFIKSNIEMSDVEFEGRQQNEPDRTISRNRELQGQSPYLINSGLTFTSLKNNLEMGAYYNVQGKTLEVIGVANIPDVYTMPFNSLNVNISKRIGKENNSTLSLRIDNVLGDIRESRYDYFGNTDFLFSSLTTGTKVTLGYSLKF